MSQTLFEPLTLRGVEFRNRIWVPPMCQYAVEKHDGVATDWHLVHLGSFARGGAGAIIVEATAVSPEGRISAKDLGLWNDEQTTALARVVSFVHSQGAAIGIQLAHAGRKASVWPAWNERGAERRHTSVPLDEGGWETIGPSALAYDGYARPREASLSDIEQIEQSFVDASRRAMSAGFDFIEIHAAHGYLLHEFLSPLSNARTDGFGGSLENRARLLLRIVQSVRREIGEDVPLLVRLSATDWLEDGLSIDDTVQIASWLREQGVDLIDVSSGGNTPAPIEVGPGYQVPFAAAVRQRSSIPTAAVGLILDPGQAEQILLTGQADVVLLGREVLRDPNFPLRAARELRYKNAPVPLPYLRAYA